VILRWAGIVLLTLATIRLALFLLIDLPIGLGWAHVSDRTTGLPVAVTITPFQLALRGGLVIAGLVFGFFLWKMSGKSLPSQSRIPKD
jgi:hypothetical protein